MCVLLTSAECVSVSLTPALCCMEAAQVSLEEAVGIHRARIPDEHRLPGSWQHHLRLAGRGRGSLQGEYIIPRQYHLRLVVLCCCSLQDEDIIPRPWQYHLRLVVFCCRSVQCRYIIPRLATSPQDCSLVLSFSTRWVCYT